MLSVCLSASTHPAQSQIYHTGYTPRRENVKTRHHSFAITKTCLNAYNAASVVCSGEVDRLRQGRQRKKDNVVHAVYRSIDLVTAILLLTGQIRIGAVFITHDSFGLSLSGPFTGSGSVPRTPQAALVLDALDVITALLLLVDQIHVIGSFLTVGRFALIVSGPPFGQPRTEAYLPRTSQFFHDFRVRVFQKYNSMLTGM